MKSMLIVSNSRSKMLACGVLTTNRGAGSANVGYRDAFDPSGISPRHPFRYGSPCFLSSPSGAQVSPIIAGDTAQCISKDALFRFANAKALFYERFRNPTSSARELRPTLLSLSHNFRSHRQILSVASLVMHLLYGGMMTPGTLYILLPY